MILEQIIKQIKPINNSTHDKIIEKIESIITLSPNVQTVMKNAYYKIGRFEGEMDYIALFYDGKKYPYSYWTEIPFNDSTLLVWEVKTNDSNRARRKMLSQHKRNKRFLDSYTRYDSSFFYAYSVGESFNSEKINLK